ncbi:MAG: polysaccharide deacetylase family protein [Bacteroidetes bacterium]|nr:polysaccharide deacetylase family protein [Bacteroidota bacterium]
MFWIKPPLRIKPYLHDALWQVKSNEKAIYLTFDDGPHPNTTPFILDLLAAHNFTATFFCLGQNVEKYPDLFERMKREGHSVGNHSYSHLNAWSTNTDVYLEDVAKAQDLIQSRLFRPPYGKLMYPEWKLLKQQYSIVMWSLMPEDFREDISSEIILSRLSRNVGRRNIIVLHENDKSKNHIKQILPRYLSLIQSQEYQVKKLPNAN